jgi:hypothetical protein
MNQERQPRLSFRIAPESAGRRRAALALIHTPLLLAPAAALAEATLKLAAFGQYEHTSNVFDLPPGVPRPGSDDFHRSDSYYSYNGEIDLSERSQLQEWYLGVHGSEVTYERFKELTHDEYWLKGGWRWQLQARLNGTLEVQRTRVMAPFSQLTLPQTQLSIDTEQREAVGVSYRFLPTWRLDGYGYLRTISEPLPSVPDLRLQESQVATTLRYLSGSGPGGAGLTVGLSAAYMHGYYTHTNGTFNPSYDQRSASLISTYVTSGRATLNGTVGYTSRQSAANNDSLSGLTGRLSYSHELTYKTSIDLVLNRSISSYLANVSSQIDSSAGIGINWRATYKLAMSACYLWTYSQFPSQGSFPGSDRLDHYQYTSAKFEYTPQDWLILRPYANLQTRSSDYPTARFNATTYGVQLQLQWQFPAPNHAGRGGQAASTTCNTPLPL